MLIGREREVAALGERLAAGAPVAVLGEAGVGKTTLVRAAAQAAGLRLLEGGGLATLSWFPYLPLKRAFGRDFEGDVAYVASNRGGARRGSPFLFRRPALLKRALNCVLFSCGTEPP
jgi:hypothetical protein